MQVEFSKQRLYMHKDNKDKDLDNGKDKIDNAPRMEACRTWQHGAQLEVDHPVGWHKGAAMLPDVVKSLFIRSLWERGISKGAVMLPDVNHPVGWDKGVEVSAMMGAPMLPDLDMLEDQPTVEPHGAPPHCVLGHVLGEEDVLDNVTVDEDEQGE